MLWAVIFVLVYGLHGTFCASANGSEELDHAKRIALIGTWLLGSAAFFLLLVLIPTRSGQVANLPRTGVWIGLVATIFTLFPVAVTTSC